MQPYITIESFKDSENVNEQDLHISAFKYIYRNIECYSENTIAWVTFQGIYEAFNIVSLMGIAIKFLECNGRVNIYCKRG